MKALIAMSGGVDSSVAALLTTQKMESIGCTMRLYSLPDDVSDSQRSCCSLEDVEDARFVCYKLGIPYYVFNFSYDFEEKIIKKFVDSYIKGITPNPCIDCNRYMKFNKLFDRMKQLECNYVVTGHYARIEQKDGKYILKKAIDDTKDQSYVLYSMTQYELSHTLFPLGNLTKNKVREIAEKNGFANAQKKDSQDICFVPDKDYASFIEKYSKKVNPGNFIDKNGEILGTHKGIVHYTIGQRKGLGISSSSPLFVCDINAKNNTVTLGQSEDLFSTEAKVSDFHLISGDELKNEIKCKVKTRYRQKEQDATVYPTEYGAKIIFESPQRAITRGQAAVLYDGDIVLGGGVII